MTTIEKLFVQIFERKNRIIEQVKQQTDLYSQHLASKLLIDGITPPTWLWNPNFNSESSDPKELKKEELISELLLPHPRPAISYSSGHCSLYNKPVVIGENGQLSEGLSMEIHASNTSFNAGDRPTTMPEFHDNDIRCALNSVPELDFSVTSPQEQIDVRVSNIYTVPDQSLARIQRSKSRQKALELRSHCKTARAAKSHLTDENDNGVCSTEIKMSRIASQQLDHDNVLLELEKCSDTISDNCTVRQGVGECLRKEKYVSIYCGRITRSRSSCNLPSHESKSLKLDNSADIAKEVGGRIMSRSTCIEEVSKPVHLSNTASQRVTRSKSSACRKSPLINSLNRSEGYHLQNVSGGELLPHFPDSNAIVNQEGQSGYVTETQLVSDGPVEAQAACSKSNLDAAGLSMGLEAFLSRPPSDCSMFVNPETLDFDDMEKCSLNEISSPMLEKERPDKSSEKGCTSVKSATSLDKITSANPSRKSSEKQSPEQEVSNKTAEGWRVSSETYVEGCVVVDEEVSESKMNKILKKVEDTSKAFQEIQDTHISHGVDVALSNVGMGLDVEMHHLMEGLEPSPELQVEEDELGFEERNQSTNTPSTFEDVQLGPSVVSSLTKVAVGDFQSFSVENDGTVAATNIILDVRVQGAEQNYKKLMQSENNVPMENKDDSAHTKILLQETKPHCKEDGLFSCCSVASPQEKHLCSIAADQTMPEFEGFIIDAEENGQPHIVGDAFSFDKLDLPSTTIERASALEQLCKFASVHTPLSQFSTTFKLQRTPDLYQSVPNGLLEHKDLRSSLNLNDDGGKPLRASYSYVDEVKCAFQGLPYADCVPYADTRFRWSLKEPPMSPVGQLWDRISSKSSSSEKQRSLNPELTCFPIEEDPSISEEDENRDVVADTIQRNIFSTLMNCGAQREPLAEITEACLNPPASVSAAERFPDRSSLDSVNTEVSFTGTHGKVKQKPGNCHSNKRRCTNEAKENRTLSVSTNYIKKATESLNNRFSKPKLSGKISLRKGGQSLSERESKRNNIVSNITSFVPLVQQKQAAAVATGKRDIKVKALEAAEAAKRLEEQRENERKMKKEAMKLERARIEQKNLRQMELKNKKKEEEQKKKNAEIVARKRLREEEERKQKERKRKRIKEAWRQPREQEENLRVGKVETEVPFGAINKEVNSRREPNDGLSKHQKMEKEKGDDNIVKKPQTEPRANEIVSEARQSVLEDCEAFSHCDDTGEPTSVLTKTTENDDLVAKTTREKSYEISPYQCSDDEDDEEDEIPSRKFIPSWASKNSVALVLSAQQNVDPDMIFCPGSFCSMDEVLQPRKLQLK